jgi:tetratricopeptide (TPR) repeat protein
MEHTGFPSEETLAAFIDGRLDAETRRRVVEHLAECSECYETFLGAGEWGREANVVPIASARPRRQFYSIATAAGIAAVMMAMLVAPAHQWYEERLAAKGLSEMAAAANELQDTSIEARLSGPFLYKPLRSPKRGSADDDDASQWGIMKVAAKSEGKESFGHLHILGAAYLRMGDTTKAIEKLEIAIEKQTGKSTAAQAVRASRDTAMLNDLSAAYYQLGLWKRDDVVLQKSLVASERSVQIAPTPQAAWNRALALQKSHAPRTASAWAEYLSLEKDPEWAEQGRAHLKEVEQLHK